MRQQSRTLAKGPTCGLDAASALAGQASEVVEPALEKLLISTEIRQLIGAGRRKAHQQCGRRDQATDRRYLRECSLSGHCSPEKIKGLRSPG